MFIAIFLKSRYFSHYLNIFICFRVMLQTNFNTACHLQSTRVFLRCDSYFENAGRIKTIPYDQKNSAEGNGLFMDGKIFALNLFAALWMKKNGTRKLFWYRTRKKIASCSWWFCVNKKWDILAWWLLFWILDFSESKISLSLWTMSNL